MATIPSENRPAAEPERLDVSPYDRASSLLISLLVTVGLATVVLVAGWLSVEVYQSRKPSGPITLVDPIGDGDGRKVSGSLLDEPATGPSAGRDARSVDPVRTRPKSGTPPPTRGPPKSRTCRSNGPSGSSVTVPATRRAQEAARKAEQAGRLGIGKSSLERA